jgi:N-formylglutamate deformylase
MVGMEVEPVTGAIDAPSSVFTLTRSMSDERPLLVEVPHAGLAMPESLRASLAVPERALHKDADIYVDALYQHAPSWGATLLVAHYSRYVVDLNRSEDDIDAQTVADHPSPRPAQARGVVWRSTTDGVPCWKQPLTYAQFLDRLARYHRPYHQTLRAELQRLVDHHGCVVLLAAHSMPSSGRSGHLDQGRRRADVVPGTQGRTTADARWIDMVDAHFRQAGFSVAHDDPYRGGWTTAHYGQPQHGVHAIQIELNRALYVNEETLEMKPSEFAALQQVLDQLVRTLASHL